MSSKINHIDDAAELGGVVAAQGVVPDGVDVESWTRVQSYAQFAQTHKLGILSLTGAERVDLMTLLQCDPRLVQAIPGSKLSEVMDEREVLLASDVVRGLTPDDIEVPSSFRGMPSPEAVPGMPKVLIIGAYEPSELPIGRFRAPPFGLVRMSSFLRQGGVDAEIFDVTQHGIDELRILLSKNTYDYIGFSVLASTLPHDVDLMHEVKRMAPNSKLIAGGQSATARPDLMEEAPLDYVCLGYGEYPFLDLAYAHDLDETDKAKIPGLMTRDNEGKFTIQETATVLKDKDITMFSACYDPALVDPRSYWDANLEQYNDDIEKVLTLRVFTQTYCPHNCNFCSSKNFLQMASGRRDIGPLRQYIGDAARQTACVKPAELSPQSFVNFLLRSLERYPQVATIFLNDDNLMVNKKRFMEIADLIEAEPAFRNVHFIASMRVDDVDDTLLKRAAEIGISEINFGVETFSAMGLKSLSKGVRTPGGISPAEVIEGAVDLARKHEITPSMNLILFYPEATFAELDETISHAIDYLGSGVKVNFATFIRAYFGADILDDGSPTESRATLIETDAGFKNLLVESRLFPDSEDVQKMALRSVEIRSLLEESFKREHNWSRKRAPKEIIVLLTFRAVYEAAAEIGLIDIADYEEQLLRINGAIERLYENKYVTVTHRTPEMSDLGREFCERNEVSLNSIDVFQVKAIDRKINNLQSVGLLIPELEPLIAELISFQKDMFLERAGGSFMEGGRFDYYGMLFHVFEKSRYWHLAPEERDIVMLMFVMEKGLSLDDVQIDRVLSFFGFSLVYAKKRLTKMLDFYLAQDSIVLFDFPGIEIEAQSEYFRELFTNLRTLLGD